MTTVQPRLYSAKKPPVSAEQMPDRLNYRRKELMIACPLPVLTGENGRITLKIHSDKGETTWLDISAEEFKLIELILKGVPVTATITLDGQGSNQE
ncbi:hypothetical protein [Ferrovum sp.]|uniref:hypothetical protein n=1 Tax=Ferrovum sp. TaxID=2609467 RepID=UPI00261C4ADB|nr:hypothetical protein [Ferrovum sp.]